MAGVVTSRIVTSMMPRLSIRSWVAGAPGDWSGRSSGGHWVALYGSQFPRELVTIPLTAMCGSLVAGFAILLIDFARFSVHLEVLNCLNWLADRATASLTVTR